MTAKSAEDVIGASFVLRRFLGFVPYRYPELAMVEVNHSEKQGKEGVSLKPSYLRRRHQERRIYFVTADLIEGLFCIF